MTVQSRKKSARVVRPIKSKRDFAGVTSVVEELSEKPGKDDVAELRLQMLLKELDRFEEPEEDADSDFSDDAAYANPRRRWSDDTE